MAFCTSCGSSLADGAVFCSNCGQRQNVATEAPAAPVYEQPVYQPPVYEQPTYQAPVYEQPTYQPYQPTYQSAPVSKGKGITAMILGIVALVLSVVDLIMSIAGLAIMGYRGAEDYGVGLLVYALLTASFAVPSLLLGKGTSSIVPGKLGKIFGLIGIIFAGIASIVALLCMSI